MSPVDLDDPRPVDLMDVVGTFLVPDGLYEIGLFDHHFVVYYTDMVPGEELVRHNVGSALTLGGATEIVANDLDRKGK